MKFLVILALVAAASVGALGSRSAWASYDSDANFCQGCRSIVSFMDRFNGSSHRSEYKGLFTEFCQNYYPVSTDFQLGPCPLIIESLFYVIDHTDSIHHCDQIGACGPSVELAPTSEIQHNRIFLGSKVGDTICLVCQEFIKSVKEAATDPDMQQKVFKIVNDFCSYLKAVDEEKECKAMLIEHLFKLMKFIKNIDPKKYCSSIKVCPPNQLRSGLPDGSSPVEVSRQLPTLADFNRFGIETSVAVDGVFKKNINKQLEGSSARRHQSVERPRLGTPTCQLCKTVVKEMFQFLRDNSTEVRIREGLDKICDMIYKDKDSLSQCKGMVDAYTKEIIELLVDETDPELICTLIDQCLIDDWEPDQVYSTTMRPAYKTTMRPTQTNPPKKQLATRRSSGNFGDFLKALQPTSYDSFKSCVECKMFIKFIREELKNSKTQEQVTDWMIGNICNSTSNESQRDECTKMIEQYAGSFFKAVVQELNPEEACKSLGACRNSYSRKVHVINIEAPQTAPVQARRRVIKKDGPVCEQCVEIITRIDDYLSQHPIDQDVSVIVDQVCNQLPNDSMKNTCTILVQTMGQDIAQAISTMDNPRQLCSKFMLCIA